MRRTVRTLLGTGAAVLLVVTVAGPASAHSASGVMGIEVTPGPAPLTAEVRVLLEYANDRHVVPGATVTATASGPDGAAVGPVTLADRGEGSYSAVLTMPAAGAWTVTVTAADPAAAATEAVTVAAGSTTSGRLEGDLGTTTTTSGRAADDDIQISSDHAAQDQRRADEGGGTSPALVAAIAVVLVAAAGVVVVLVRGRRRTP